MNNKFKFKFLNFSYTPDADEFTDEFTEVSNPTPYNNLPDGEYIVRGNKQFHRKEYWKNHNTWYFINEYTYDNGHYMCDAEKYLLFPNLSENEWDALNNPIIKNKLTKYWKRALYGRNFWMNLRNTSREVVMSYNRFNKEIETVNN